MFTPTKICGHKCSILTTGLLTIGSSDQSSSELYCKIERIQVKMQLKIKNYQEVRTEITHIS